MAYQIHLEAIVTGKDVVAKVEQMINTAQKTADRHPIKIGTGNLDPKYVQSINKAIQGIKPIARKNFFGDSYDEAEKLGIDLMSYDDEQELTKEQKRYVRKAIILLCAGKTVPEEIVKHLPKKAMA